MKNRLRKGAVVLAALLLLGSAAIAACGRTDDRPQNVQSIATVSPAATEPDIPPMPAPESGAVPGATPEPTPAPVTLEDIRALTFSDVEPGTPTADCVSYAAYHGILMGVGNGHFDPDGLVTRAMAVTVLYRMSGETAGPAGAFSDVSADDWFAPAAAWAAKEGIATGYEDGTFRPHLPVTRAQLSALFHRIAGAPREMNKEQVLSEFTDGDQVPDYARESMAWALENRLFTGMVTDTIYPGLSVTRVQLAQMLAALSAYNGGDEIAELITDSLCVVSVSFTPEVHQQLQAAVDAAAKKYGAVGMQVAVIHNGEVMDSFAAGWATKGTDPMTVDHKLRVASLSKVDVALAAMVLWDQGIIDLDESIGTYWGAAMRNPYYKDVPVSIRSILSHTSSIGLFEDASLRTSAVRSKLTSSSGYSYGKPGALSSYGYNNYAFGVLGMTLELAAGKNLNQVMAPIFSTLDIDVSYFSGNIKDSSLHTTLYYHDGSVGRSLSTARGNVAPSSPGGNGAFFSGGFTASAKDQAALVALLAGDGKFQGVPLLSKEAVELMESPLGYISDGGYYQCHPLRYQEDLYGRDKLYYHTGSAFGVYNLLSYDPETGDGVVVFTSGASAAKDSRGIYAVCGSVSAAVYDLLLDPGSFYREG